MGGTGPLARPAFRSGFPMPYSTRRQLRIALPVVLLLAAVVIVVVSGMGLPSRLTEVQVGMTRAEAEAILGPPALVLPRTNRRGHLSAWVDQFWQVDVITGPDGRVERISCGPSDRASHRTIGWFLSLRSPERGRRSVGDMTPPEVSAPEKVLAMIHVCVSNVGERSRVSSLSDSLCSLWPSPIASRVMATIERKGHNRAAVETVGSPQQ